MKMNFEQTFNNDLDGLLNAFKEGQSITEITIKIGKQKFTFDTFSNVTRSDLIENLIADYEGEV